MTLDRSICLTSWGLERGGQSHSGPERIRLWAGKVFWQEFQISATKSSFLSETLLVFPSRICWWWAEWLTGRGGEAARRPERWSCWRFFTAGSWGRSRRSRSWAAPTARCAGRRRKPASTSWPLASSPRCSASRPGKRPEPGPDGAFPGPRADAHWGPPPKLETDTIFISGSW